MAVVIAQVSAEHHHDGFGLFTATPRLSWRFGPTVCKSWSQTSYELVITRQGGEVTESFTVQSPQSVLVPWPGKPLSSCEAAHIRVRATGADEVQTPWAELTVETALLERDQWKAKMITGPRQAADQPKKPFTLRKTFFVPRSSSSLSSPSSRRARLYATAFGVYKVSINGKPVGNDVMAPGWQSYRYRLHYQTYDIGPLLQEGADNEIVATIGEGWFAGRIGVPPARNIWGDRLGFLGQVEIDGNVACITDASWTCVDSAMLSSEIYDGEVFDTMFSGREREAPNLGAVEELPFPEAELVAPEVAPVRRIAELKADKIITTPSGKTILDFGQNISGFLRIEVDIPAQHPGDTLLIRHAEVLEHDELGTRPLRSAKAREQLQLGGKTKGYEPSFTWHGFRYAEISVTPGNSYQPSLTDFTAIAISSDLRRTGTFTCSHPLIRRLHENAVWSMRDNFVSVPTDCPQRDERLGWTGDIQVFTPTASFLFDTSAFLGSWLCDVALEQKHETDGGSIVPMMVPHIAIQSDHFELLPQAIWADCAVLTPWDLYCFFGDQDVLERQWDSMQRWLDQGVPRDVTRNEGLFYSTETFQFGDWLDPRAPPEMPGKSPTDQFLVANAYLTHVTRLTSRIAALLKKDKESQRFADQAARLLRLFQDEYVSSHGRISSDTQAAYALALLFDLLSSGPQQDGAKERLGWITRYEAFKITTGFAGTPILLQALADAGHLNLAYRMLEETEEPSWLYPVTMGATTIWERWNSMLPDGSINPGTMTSFNHYALGSVASFLHSTVGGLSSLLPGWQKALVRPEPGGTVRSASTSFDSPYGTYAVDWKIVDGRLKTHVQVPPNGTAQVVLPGMDDVLIGSGQYDYDVAWKEDPDWPPQPIPILKL